MSIQSVDTWPSWRWIPGLLDVNTLPYTHKCVALCKCVHGLMNLDTLPDACRWLHMQMDTQPRAFQKKSHVSVTLNFLFIQLTVFCHCKVSDRNLQQVLALLSLNLSVSSWGHLCSQSKNITQCASLVWFIFNQHAHNYAELVINDENILENENFFFL
jgi:hypothetical protein